jgi:penicillin-binding protein 1C
MKTGESVKRWKKWTLRLALGGTLLCASIAAVIILAIEIAGAVGDFPEELLRTRPGSVRIEDRQGKLLRETLSEEEERTRWVRLDEVSPRLVAALLAAEDAHFFEHKGVDYRAFVRAAMQTMAGHHSGGSTITQQVVKLMSTPRPRTLSAKWREVVLSRRLERRLSKREILEQYVNRAPFGPREVGAEAAARVYFGKPPAQLSLAEAALLGGLPKAPVGYDPRRHPERALQRRSWVLARMEKIGFVSAKERAWAEKEPLQVLAAAPPFEAPHFTARVLRDVPPGASAVRTTLDGRLQRRAEVLVRRTIAGLKSRNATQAAAIVIENQTGEVLAYVGSVDWADPREGRNDGSQALRQPGSALKPFAYALGLEKEITPGTVLADLPAHFTTPKGEYSPRNYDGRFHGPVLPREALANSYNVPAVRVAHRLTPSVLLERLRDLGFGHLQQDEDHYGLGLVLGNGEVSLYELARAYLALARGGERIEPIFVAGSPQPEPRRVLSPEAVYLVTHMLSDPHARKSAFGESSALDLPFAAAVKTGTSTDYRDNWTAGFTPEITVAVWVGNFSGQPMRNVSGVSGAAPLWNELIQMAMEGRPRRSFARPAELAQVHICPRSGKLAGPSCGGGRLELFRAGTAPTETCDVHVEVAVDRRNGLLAGPGCGPKERRRVRGERYAPELSAWAAAAKRPLVPARYSPLCPGSEEGVQVRIVSPRNGEVLTLTPDLPRRAQRLELAAVVEGAPAAVRWLVDGREVGRAAFPYSGRWQIEPGEHEVIAVAGERESDPVRVTVRD